VNAWPKPTASRRALLALAGSMWLGVGALLLRLGSGWLAEAEPAARWFLAAAGLVPGLLIHHLGFLRIVDRNLGRIRAAPDKPCAFSFMPARSYGLVALMMAMGWVLRHSAVPRPWLAVLYLMMGSALLLSSVRYLRGLVTSWRELARRVPGAAGTPDGEAR